jgi:hypothetical protein
MSEEEKPKFVLEVQDVYAELDLKLLFKPKKGDDDGKDTEQRGV